MKKEIGRDKKVYIEAMTGQRDDAILEGPMKRILHCTRNRRRASKRIREYEQQKLCDHGASRYVDEQLLLPSLRISLSEKI